MAENESAPRDNVTGGASGNESAGGGGGEGKDVPDTASGQTPLPRPLFVGHIFPAPLDKDGRLEELSLLAGLGEAHLVSFVYAFDKNAEGEDQNLHANIDNLIGQPYFKAYIYPVHVRNQKKIDALNVGGGGGEGKAVLGGVLDPKRPIYLGQFHAVLSDNGDSGSTPDSGGGAPPTPEGGGAPHTP